jgi:glycosyltransferase involved in cell wall biosynthesis
MEAMSCHIPLIAPAIGGIPEMVFSGYNGILISPGCCPDLIAEHIGNIDFFKNKTIRENSYKVYKKNFTIQNYNIFLKSVKEICL